MPSASATLFYFVVNRIPSATDGVIPGKSVSKKTTTVKHPFYRAMGRVVKMFYRRRLVKCHNIVS